MKMIGKILLGVTLVGSVMFASCSGCGDSTTDARNNDSIATARGVTLEEGQSFNDKGDLVDRDGKVVMSSGDIDKLQPRGAQTDIDVNVQERPIEAMGEKEFVQAVIRTNTEQLALLEAGTRNCSDPKMMEAAQKMLDDHTLLRNEINTYAEVHNIGIPDLTQQKAATINAKAGRDWDMAFADRVANNDARLISLFESGKMGVDNTDIQVIIEDYMPKLQQHSMDAGSWQSM